MKYQEIKDKKQADYNALFTNCGVFWAFSNKQFEEGYEKVKPTMAEDEKLVAIGGGGYIPKHNVEALMAGTEAIDATFKKTNSRKQSKRATYTLRIKQSRGILYRDN